MHSTLPQNKEINNARKWRLIDCKGQILGKVAASSAYLLRGKHKSNFTPERDCGDYVILINSKHIHTTGNKIKNKKYYKHTGYMGHLKQATLAEMMNRNPNKVLELAISGMIPRNRLSNHILNKLFIYEEEEHKHSAQKPVLYKPGAELGKTK